MAANAAGRHAGPGHFVGLGGVAQRALSLRNVVRLDSAALGRLLSAGGSVYLYGTLTPSSLGSIINDGGSVVVEGTISPGTLVAGGSSGLSFQGATLDDVVYEGVLDLTPESSSVYIQTNLTATGATGTGSGTIDVGQYSTLNFEDTQTFDDATINLEGYGSTLEQYTTYAAYAANGYTYPSETLTLGSGVTIVQTGSSDTLGSSGYYYYYGYGDDTIVNDGSIDVESGSLTIDPSSFINDGTIDVTGGTLNLEGTWTNAGTVEISAGSVQATAVSGSGEFELSGDAWLTLNGAIGADESIVMSGQAATIEIGGSAEPNEVDATISGFVVGDQIVVDSQQITSAVYTATGATSGDLVLSNGQTVVETLDLVGQSYASADDVFTVSQNGANSTIALQEPAPDLAVSDIVTPSSGTSGDQVSISWTVTNGGLVAATGPWTDEVYLASDASGDDPQALAGFTFDGEIAAGASVTRTETVTLPPSFSGDFWFVVQTDSLNQVYENPGSSSKETVASTPTDIVPPPALTAVLADDTGVSASDGITSDDALTGTADPGSTVNFTVDGQAIAATAMANSSGIWTFTPSGRLVAIPSG